jgi:pantetheine-phosphate adenylyltransferase
MAEILAIYPGSFDPITNGHLDLIERGSQLFNRLIVAVLTNLEKDPVFTVPERVEMLQAVTHTIPNVKIDTFSGLLVDYARQKQAQVILRGIRAFTDYEYELQMALMNRKLAPELETVFLMPALAYTFVSSRLVREIFQYGGSVKGLVPPLVEERLHQKVFAPRRGAP